MKLMAGKLKAVSGKVTPGHHAVIGYQAQEFSELLPDELSVYDAVREALPAGASTANLMNILGSFGFSGDDVEKRCGVLSGGERIRLQFARIFVNPPNLLVLDEPTTHLDVAARELLQQALRDFKGTVCFVSHDIEFVRQVATSVVVISPDGVKKFFGNYDYYLEKSAASQTPEPETVKSDNSGTMLAKDRRRMRAQARSAIASELRESKKRLAQLEAELDKLSEQKQVLIAKLSSGMKLDFSQLKKELSEVEQRLENVEQSWETAALETEALKLENDRINSEVGR
jgi:ATP-binding cassette subfamily F protein 3